MGNAAVLMKITVVSATAFAVKMKYAAFRMMVPGIAIAVQQTKFAQKHAALTDVLNWKIIQNTAAHAAIHAQMVLFALAVSVNASETCPIAMTPASMCLRASKIAVFAEMHVLTQITPICTSRQVTAAAADVIPFASKDTPIAIAISPMGASIPAYFAAMGL